MLIGYALVGVLLAVVVDLILSDRTDPTDRAVSLAALSAIGLALAVGLSRYLTGDADDPSDPDADDTAN